MIFDNFHFCVVSKRRHIWSWDYGLICLFTYIHIHKFKQNLNPRRNTEWEGWRPIKKTREKDCPPNYWEIILTSQKLSKVCQGRINFPTALTPWKWANTISSWNSIKKNFSCHNKTSSYMAYTFHCHNPFCREDIFHTLEKETCPMQAQGNVLVCGDLNAKTGLQLDFTDTAKKKY